MRDTRSSPLSEPADKNSAYPYGTVTFLFTDIEGSTSPWERMPTEMREAVAQHRLILRQAVEENE
jgi:class 3 adenylate cyclase